MKGASVRRLFRLLMTPLAAMTLAALAVLTVVAPGAHAATDLSTVGAALRESPVYVDPAASDLLSRADAEALADTIEDADEPIFVAVLPAGYPSQDLFRNLRTETGVTGLYAVRLGDRFDARADSSVLSRQAVANLVSAVQGAGDPKAQLNDFVDDALRSNPGGTAPSSWSGGGDQGVDAGGLVVAGAVVAAGGAGAYALVRRNRRRKEEERREALARLAVVVDEDITAFGEELDRLDFHPAELGADDAMRADYERALDAYEKAKSLMAAATRPEDVRAVTQTLEDGRFSLA
ncbi:MAG TPA: hypothetical protein VLG91_00040, partial [Streptomyces sp.]|nr:hypothetical protein [Streptomyces sp.]